MNRYQRIHVALAVALSAITFSAPSAATEAVHWNYADGTEGWGYLDAAFVACSTGIVQSPVDVVTSQVLESDEIPNLRFRYSGDTSLDVEHNGHTIEAIPLGSGNTLSLGSKVYQLLQFHVHTPSENFLNGEQYPLEMHFVHKASDGSLAVVGVFFDEGPANLQLQKIVAVMPSEEGVHAEVPGFALRSLLPVSNSFRFQGSLTTPPCSEGVAWHVMTKPMTASLEQLAAFTVLFSGIEFPSGNRRPVQPLNGRTITTEELGD